MTATAQTRPDERIIDSSQAWFRLAVAVLISTLGGVGMWSVVVVLPAVQAEFGVDRSTASLPYTLTMLGFAAGGVISGRLSDRYGVAVPVAIGTVCLALGYVLSGFATGIITFALAQGLLIGMLGSASTFTPLVADVSLWFARRRGIAVAICACGNYAAGTFWPPVVQHFMATSGWRATQIGVGLVLLVTMLPLVLLLRRRPPAQTAASAAARPVIRPETIGLTPSGLTGLLWFAGLACCVAMSMPQVHIVAYCGDLGYGVARGAEMLSLMLAFGIISRLASGLLADRIGGVPTLLIGSLMQGVALLLYLMFDSLTSLYVISALFGLFQGGIVPSYAIIVREYFPSHEAGTRVGFVLMSTLLGMALGGWLSGKVFDITGSYAAAFANGVAWNAINLTLTGFLLWRSRTRAPAFA